MNGLEYHGTTEYHFRFLEFSLSTADETTKNRTINAKQTDLIIRPFYLPMRKFSNYITADSRETESEVHSRTVRKKDESSRCTCSR